MKPHVQPVASTEAVDTLFEQSAEGPVVVFNHDPYCPISLGAYKEMMTLPHDIAMVNVSRDTQVTRHIAKRSGVTHESPQVIVLHNGAAIWSASHFAITRHAVEEALQQVQQGT
jgi:bacillithiol system protein YtxJ